MLYDAKTQRCRVHALHFTEKRSVIEECDGDASISFSIWYRDHERQPRVSRAGLAGYGIDLAHGQTPSAEGVKALCCMPLLSHNQALGALNVGRQRDDAFAAEDVELLNQVAQQIAIAVENGLAYQEIADLNEGKAQ